MLCECSRIFSLFCANFHLRHVKLALKMGPSDSKLIWITTFMNQAQWHRDSKNCDMHFEFDHHCQNSEKRNNAKFYNDDRSQNTLRSFFNHDSIALYSCILLSKLILYHLGIFLMLV